jgi:phosphatidylserine/phosphatidylglycerophosphate/cardiolipin synthase-like enzyme
VPLSQAVSSAILPRMKHFPTLRSLAVSVSLLLLVAVSALAKPVAAPAKAATPAYELVLTVPAETDLGVPGVRSPTVVWPELFDGAKKRIDIEQFYLAHEEGKALEPVLQSLERAAKRGVQVRVLVEQVFLGQSQPVLDRMKAWPNTETRVLPWAKVGKGGIIHAKFMIVDSKFAFVGSQNFDWRAISQIHETGLKIADPEVVGQVQAVFDFDWSAAALVTEGKTVEPLQQTPPPARIDRSGWLVASPWAFVPTGVGDSEGELVRLIGTAQKRLQIQVLQYAPLRHGNGYYPVIDNALRAAAARGVQVQLMVSNWNAAKPDIQWLKSLALVPGVEVKMVVIPEMSTGFVPYSRVVHSKYMVVDGEKLWLGTSNWQGGYLDESRNLEVVVADPVLAAQAAAVHVKLWDSKYAETLDVMKDYPKARKK